MWGASGEKGGATHLQTEEYTFVSDITDLFILKHEPVRKKNFAAIAYKNELLKQKSINSVTQYLLSRALSGLKGHLCCRACLL